MFRFSIHFSLYYVDYSYLKVARSFPPLTHFPGADFVVRKCKPVFCFDLEPNLFVWRWRLAKGGIQLRFQLVLIVLLIHITIFSLFAGLVVKKKKEKKRDYSLLSWFCIFIFSLSFVQYNYIHFPVSFLICVVQFSISRQIHTVTYNRCTPILHVLFILSFIFFYFPLSSSLPSPPYSYPP